MKVLKTTDTIVVLENVLTVSKHIAGSGAQSNPYRYSLNIEYVGEEEEVNLYFDTDKTEFEKCFSDIYKILSEEDE